VLINYFFLLTTIVHYAAAVWLVIGDRYIMGDLIEPWMVANSDFHESTKWQLYVFSMYWILVCITTVGYGDYTGGTNTEIIVTLCLEIIGLFVFSILMSIVTDFISKSYDFADYKDSKQGELQY
jgi:glucan phosphoethanolaminetransferase (alkaline phosphatase superfamily)